MSTTETGSKALGPENHPLFKCGASLLTLKETALFLQQDEGFLDLLNDPRTDEYKLYHAGRIQTKMYLNNALITASADGSVPAINKLIGVLNRMERQQVLEG